MSGAASASESGVVGRDRVCLVVQGLLRGAQAMGWTDEALGEASQLSPRLIKSYRVEGKEPPLSSALSIGVALGKPAVNAILSLIGYTGAHPLDEPDDLHPNKIVAIAMAGLTTIATAAIDNRIDHTEKPDCRIAADSIIAAMMPLSSMADAG